MNITIENLKKLINNHKSIIKESQEFGYTNIRFFKNIDDKLSVICRYDSSLLGDKNPINDFDLGKKIADLIGLDKVIAYAEGCMGLKEYDYEEANQYPISNIRKATEFFTEILIPDSIDRSLTSKELEEINQLLNDKTVKRKYDIFHEKNKKYSSEFFKENIDAIFSNIHNLDPSDQTVILENISKKTKLAKEKISHVAQEKYNIC